MLFENTYSLGICMKCKFSCKHLLFYRLSALMVKHGCNDRCGQ